MDLGFMGQRIVSVNHGTHDDYYFFVIILLFSSSHSIPLSFEGMFFFPLSII